LGGSVPHAIKMTEELGKDGFIAVMVESQGLAADEIGGFMAQRFPGSELFLTNEAPFRGAEQGGGIPFAMLIGIDGTLLWQGNPNGAVKKVEDLVAAELKKVKTGWGATPEIKKARALMFSKGALGEAAALLASIEQNIKEDAKADFDAAKAELDRLYAARKAGIDGKQKEARFDDAETMAKDLAKSVKGHADWEKEVAAIVATFAEAETAKEVKLAQQIEKIFQTNGKKKPTPDLAKKLRDLAKKNAEAKAVLLAEKRAKQAEYVPH
jgi:hypothetical protein